MTFAFSTIRNCIVWELFFAFTTIRNCIVWEWIVGSVLGSAGKPSLFGDLGDYCAVQSPPESPLGHPSYVHGSPTQVTPPGHLLGHPKIIVHHPPQLGLPGIIRAAVQNNAALCRNNITTPPPASALQCALQSHFGPG